MKHEWKKHEKELYMPKNKPELIDVPELSFFTIKGKGNPNSAHFAEYITALYAVSYAVRMSYKSMNVPKDYFEYSVYPLEGVWDITDEAKARGEAKLNKDELVFKLMIRQPSFVTPDLAKIMLDITKQKKKLPLLEQVAFEAFTEGCCIQMLHLGSYDSEPESFDRMQIYCDSLGLKRASKIHREIYLTDARKTDPDKLKTVLRFKTI